MKPRRVMYVLFLLAAMLLVAGCGEGREDSAVRGAPGEYGTPPPAEPVPVPWAGLPGVERFDLEQGDREEIIAECMALAELCGGEMERAENGSSEYFPYEAVLARQTLDALEELLAAAGYPVLDTDEVYPEYLRNSEGLKGFAEQPGEPARQAIVSVTRYRSLVYSLFERRSGELWHICASVYWDGDGSFTVSEPYAEAVREWGYAGDEFFYYRVYPFDSHWDACMPVRLSPADRELYDLCAEYVRPLGYQGTNIFLVDWAAGDWGKLSLNDVFEYLYFLRSGERVDTHGFEYSERLGCCLVSAELFEGTLLPYFDISAQELRSMAGYMAESDAYPWRPVISTDIQYFPTLTPEVRECRDNGDGTLTLRVDVLCFDEKCFPLFTHELTVARDENGNFKYLGNELVYVSGHSMPNADARMAAR